MYLETFTSGRCLLFLVTMIMIWVELSNCVIMANIILDFGLVSIGMASHGIPASRENRRPKALPLRVNKSNARGR